jgi:hypothetical protein
MEMTINDIENMFACGVKLGVIQTLKELNLLDNRLTMPKAHSEYGRKTVERWLLNGWVQLYSTGNQKRGRYYLRRSECETAKLMLDASNILDQNAVDARVRPLSVKRNKNKHIILSNNQFK